MSTKKAIGISFVAIFILIIAQIIAQVIASVFVIIKIPYGICNIIAGIIYAGLTYLILKMFISKIIKLPTSDFGMPKFEIKIRWILIAILLPCIIKGIYVLIFNGEYVSSNMNGNEMFNTLSAGVAFTGIAAGFVEEMAFRGVILIEEKMEYEGGCNCSINVIWHCTCSGTGFFDRQLFISHYRWNYGRRYVFNDCNREWFGLE